jgi:hypothetical protein
MEMRPSLLTIYTREQDRGWRFGLNSQRHLRLGTTEHPPLRARAIHPHQIVLRQSSSAYTSNRFRPD